MELSFAEIAILKFRDFFAKFPKIFSFKILGTKVGFAHLLNLSRRNHSTNTVIMPLRLLSLNRFKYSCFKSLFCRSAPLFVFTTIAIKPRRNVWTHICKIQIRMVYVDVKNFHYIIQNVSQDDVPAKYLFDTGKITVLDP